MDDIKKVVALKDAVVKYRKSEGPAQNILKAAEAFKRPSHLEQYRKEMSEKQWKRWAEKRAGQNVTNEELKQYRRELAQKSKDLLKHAQLWIRCEPEAFVKILQDGRFKSQFETGTSRGVLSLTARAKAEKALFGLPLDLPEELRPIYGSPTNHPDGRLGNNTLDRFGPVAIRLNLNDLIEFSTTTLYDSLSVTDGQTYLEGKPVSLKKVLGLGETNTLVDEHEQTDENQTLFSDSGGDCFALGFWDHIKRERKENDQEPTKIESLHKINPYAEFHGHGGEVEVKHIAEVVFLGLTEGTEKSPTEQLTRYLMDWKEVTKESKEQGKKLGEELAILLEKNKLTPRFVQGPMNWWRDRDLPSPPT